MRGGPRERGRQHGLEAADLIRNNVDATYERLSAVDVDRGEAKALRISLDRAVERYAPSLLEEMEGIAAGAEVSVDEILTLNCYPDLGIGMSVAPGCTTAIARHCTTNEVFLWQNNDAYAGFGPGMIVLHVIGKTVSHTQVTYAGVVGESGMNSLGVAVAGNGLYTRHSRSGVPFLALMRLILDSCASVEEVVDVLTAHPRAVGMSYAVADSRGEGAYIETSADAVQVTRVEDWMAHANHCLAPEVRATETLMSDNGQNSASRLASAEAQLRAGDAASLSTLQAVARSHNGICQHRDTTGFMGYVTSLYGLIAAPASKSMWLASGSPCENPFELVESPWAAYAAA